MSDTQFAMVCSANVNRSVAAHISLSQAGLNVASFGAGNSIKLPGASASSPNVYTFGQHTYKDILEDLQSKDVALYTRNGLIDMLKRDMALKPAPQRFQDHNMEEKTFDVVLCFEKRVMEAVVAHLNSIEDGNYPILVVNMDVRDSLKDADVAAPRALTLCKLLLEGSGHWEDNIDLAVTKFKKEFNIELVYTVCFVLG